MIIAGCFFNNKHLPPPKKKREKPRPFSKEHKSRVAAVSKRNVCLFIFLLATLEESLRKPIHLGFLLERPQNISRQRERMGGSSDPKQVSTDVQKQTSAELLLLQNEGGSWHYVIVYFQKVLENPCRWAGLLPAQVPVYHLHKLNNESSLWNNQL